MSAPTEIMLHLLVLELVIVKVLFHYCLETELVSEIKLGTSMIDSPTMEGGQMANSNTSDKIILPICVHLEFVAFFRNLLTSVLALIANSFWEEAKTWFFPLIIFG